MLQRERGGWVASTGPEAGAIFIFKKEHPQESEKKRERQVWRGKDLVKSSGGENEIQTVKKNWEPIEKRLRTEKRLLKGEVLHQENELCSKKGMRSQKRGLYHSEVLYIKKRFAAKKKADRKRSDVRESAKTGKSGGGKKTRYAHYKRRKGHTVTTDGCLPRKKRLQPTNRKKENSRPQGGMIRQAESPCKTDVNREY